MIDVALDRAWTHDAASTASGRLRRLIDRAAQESDLPAADVYMLGDWIAPLGEEDADALGLLLIALFLAVSEGSLAVELSIESLSRRLAELVDGESQAWMMDGLLRGMDRLSDGAFADVVGDGNVRGVVDRHPLLLWQRDGGDGQAFLYFQKHLRAEQDLHARLSRRAGRESRSPGDVERVLREVLVEQPLLARGQAIRWDPDQLTAVALALSRDLVIVSGGPGTGKTSVVLTMLRCLARLGVPAERIAVAAATGRAAQRLGDALRAGVETLTSEVDRGLGTLTATTLHGLLDYHPGRNIFRRHEENPIAADVVVVDEVSMVSVGHMASLLRAVRADARLILLGDKDQLPSVEAGAVLAQLTPLDEPAFSPATREQVGRWLPEIALASGPDHWLRDSVVLLRTNHRSEPAIRDAAAAINAQDVRLVDALPRFSGEWGVGCWWWEQTVGTAAELRGQIDRWAAHVYDEPLASGETFRQLVSQRASGDAWFNRVFEALERTRLLTLLREGPWGCRPINEAMAGWLRRRSSADEGLTPGTPILVTRNDKTRGLFNGDVGVVILDRLGQTRVAFWRRGENLILPPESLPSHELGFALTVHKSQGSEYREALVVLPPSGGRRLLTKELLYTAVTRAKSLAVVSATREAFVGAIGRRIVRESGM